MNGQTVLICEDEGLTSLRLRGTLTRLGYLVVGAARDGEEAVAAALDLGPDVIVMDLEMPRMGGIAAIRAIMERQPAAILVVSAYSDRETVTAALAAGASGYLVKPAGDAEIEPALNAAVLRFNTPETAGRAPTD